MENLDKMGLAELFFIIETTNIYQKNGYGLSNVFDQSDIYNKINKYYKEKNGKILDINIDSNKKDLYEWAKEESRYSVLSSLLKLVLMELTNGRQIHGEIINNTDLFMSINVPSLISIMVEQCGICFSSINTENVEVSKLNKKEVDNYVCRILTEIDPTLEWLEIYTNAKKDKSIIYLNELTEEEKLDYAKKLGEKFLATENACMVDLIDPDNSHILLTYKGTIEDVSTTMHEFAHYITMKKNPGVKSQQTLNEFASTFYELYSLEFLKKNGYTEKEISTINSARSVYTIAVAENVLDIFIYMQLFLKDFGVTEDIDIKYNKEIIKNKKKLISEQTLKERIKNDPDSWNPKKLAHKNCDNCIEQLILNSDFIYILYPYIFGHYLAIKGMENLSTDKDMLSKIKNYTEKSADIDPYEVFKGVGCDVKKLGLKRSKSSDIKIKVLK